MTENWIKKNVWQDRANENAQAPEGTKFSEVKERFKKIDPGVVNDASAEYIKAANALADYTRKLEGYADKLIKHWKGENAQKALDQLGQVHRTSAKMSDKSLATSNSFKWYGTEILPHYKAVGETMEDGWDDDDSDDNRWAKEKLERLFMRTAQSHNNVPQEVEQDLPERTGGNTPPPGGPPGGGGGGVGGGGGGGGKFPGGSPGGMPDGGKFPDGDRSPFASLDNNRNPHLDPSSYTGTRPGSSQLAGLGDPGGASFGGAGGGSNLSSMGDGGGMPGGGGGGLGGGGGNYPGGGGPGGLGSGAVGTAGMGGGAFRGAGAGAGAGRMGGMPMGGMPMGGAGQGNQGEQERERETWLTEDEDVWGADDDTAPPVIG
ncbi:hypothetical protein ACFY4C_14275 [Actinomadura viridis]|uniref:hypothetical protein n=1 Tax=Actinomadura viridis TaxID=58110 RepID=UPI003686ADAC